MFKPKVLLILQVICVLLTIVAMGMQIKALYESRKPTTIGV